MPDTTDDPAAWIRAQQVALQLAFASGRDARPIVAGMFDAPDLAAEAFEAAWASFSARHREEIEADMERVLENRYCELSRVTTVSFDAVTADAPVHADSSALVTLRYDDPEVGVTLVEHSLSREGGRWRVRDVRVGGVSYHESFVSQFRRHIAEHGVDATRTRLDHLADADTWPPGIPDSCAPPPTAE